MHGIQYIRELHSFTLKDLAEKLSEKEKISSQAVSMWENGNKKIPDKRLKQLSEIFNIDEGYFSKEVSDIDKLIIDNFRLEKELKDTTVSYEDYVVDDKTGKYEKATFETYDKILAEFIEHNKAKIEALKVLQKINNAILDSDDVESFDSLQSSISSNTRLFNRFADIVISNKTSNYILHEVMCAIELTHNAPKSLESESDLVQNIYEALKRYLDKQNEESWGLMEIFKEDKSEDEA